MANPRVHRVAVPVSDVDAAEKFYSALLDNEGKRILPDRHYYDLGDFILAFYQPPESGTWSFDQKPVLLPVHARSRCHACQGRSQRRYLPDGERHDAVGRNDVLCDGPERQPHGHRAGGHALSM